MRRCTAILIGLAAVTLLPLSSRGDYLGKSVGKWHEEFNSARDSRAKRNAAFALGKLSGQSMEAVPDLLQCLANESEDLGVRETVAYSLGQIVTRGRAEGELVQLLCKLASTKAEDDRLTRSAVIALGACGSDTDEIRVALDRALDNSSAGVRQNAAWAIGEIFQNAESPPMATLRKALASKEKDRLVKRDAALALGKMISEIPTGGGDAGQRERARVKNVREQARALLSNLMACVTDEYGELKKAATGTLINLVTPDDKKWQPVLAKACSRNEDIEVRFNAAQALAAIGGKGSEGAVPVLRDVLRTKKFDPEHKKNGDATWRQNAVLAFRNLGEVGSPALNDLLDVLAKDADVKIRYYTAVAFGGWKTDSKEIVPALVDRVVDANEDVEVRVASAMALQSLGKNTQAVAAIPQLVGVLADPQQPARVRERVLWALRVHQEDLAKYDKIFAALKEILVDPNLREPASGGKMLRYDAAYLFGRYKHSDAPEEVFPVLNDFLNDPSIRIFTGIATGGGRVAEGGSSRSVVAEQAAEDGRIMAVQALQDIGGKRAREHGEVIESLKKIRDSNGTVEPKLREATTKLLKEWKVK